jgi:hypothetical protein
MRIASHVRLARSGLLGGVVQCGDEGGPSSACRNFGSADHEVDPIFLR